MIKFIEPKVNERFAKMEDLGDAWNDAPVRPLVHPPLFLFMKWERRVIC